MITRYAAASWASMRITTASETFAALCVEAGLSVEMEKGPDKLRPADGLVHGIDNCSLDDGFSVVHSLQLFADLAEVHPRKLARPAEKYTVRARMPACRQLGRSFCPFMVEATGTWGRKARHLTQLVTQKYALRHHCSKEEAGNACRTRLQFAL